MKKTTNIVLLCLGAFYFTFIFSMVCIFCVKGAVPDVLIDKALDIGSLELFALAVIKISKVLKGQTEDESEDETNV